MSFHDPWPNPLPPAPPAEPCPDCGVVWDVERDDACPGCGLHIADVAEQVAVMAAILRRQGVTA